jgi:hypothetical protein
VKRCFFKTLAVTLVCGCLVGSVRADYVAEVLRDNPVAYWRLGEMNIDAPIVDLTGNVPDGDWDDFGGLDFGYDGAIVGDSNTAVKFAEPSNFSCGACSRGVIPVGGVLDLGTVDSDQPITLEAWFKILPSVDEGLPITSFPRIFHYNNFDGGQYAFGVVGDNNAGFEGQRTVWAGRGDGGDSGVVIMSGETDMITPSLDEEWFHFVALLDADDVRLFLNGEELGDVFDSDPIFWQAEQATIGARVQSDGVSLTQPFPGLIDELAIYNTLLSPERIQAHYLAGIGELATIDIDTLQAAIRAGTNDPNFDLNGDGLVNGADQDEFVRNTLNTWTGDSNLDGEFNSSDFVFVFTQGEYEDNDPSDPSTILNSTWADGDWNADGEFDSSDFVRAFQEGGYEQGPRAAVASVPEPTGALILATGLLLLPIRRRPA